MNEKLKEFHIQFGRDSGIPECCIQFYVNEWVDICTNYPKMFTMYHNQLQLRRKTMGQNWNHTPCPTCLYSGKVVKVIKCAAPWKFNIKSNKKPQTFYPIIDSDGYIIDITY